MPEIQDYLFKYHKRGGHTVTYAVNKQETGTTSYYQYISTDDYWYMLKSVRAAAVVTYTYTVPVIIGTTTLAAGWTNRADLTYTTFNLAFQ